MCPFHRNLIEVKFTMPILDYTICTIINYVSVALCLSGFFASQMCVSCTYGCIASYYGAIQVLRNAVGGVGCQFSRKKALRRCTVQRY